MTEIPANEQRFTVRPVGDCFRIWDELRGTFASGEFYEEAEAMSAARRQNLYRDNREAMRAHKAQERTNG